MENQPKRTPLIRDMMISLMHDMLDAAEDEGVSGWHLIREIEGRVWEARTRTHTDRVRREAKAS